MMPYTQAFLAEVMRYRTVLPLGVPRVTTTDTKLREYMIPKVMLCFGTTPASFIRCVKCWNQYRNYKSMRRICAVQVYVLTRQVKMASPKGIAKLANPNHGGNPKRCGN